MDDDALTEYMADATDRFMSRFLKNTLSNRKTSAFVSSFLVRSRLSSAKRRSYQRKGLHVPGFLICSITDRCNLRCKGCYAAANGIIEGGREEMSVEQWEDVFVQAKGYGISFVILAGGEPLLRKEVLRRAASMRSIVFPVFTNGTLVEQQIGFFDRNRNMVPIMSIDGQEASTDERRGRGTYRKVMECFDVLNAAGVFHGASVTVTSENVGEVTSDGFAETLHAAENGVVFFIEFVPSRETMHLALGDDGRKTLSDRVKALRERYKDVVFMSFPGDEKNFGGCIGAGRGFVHINPYGDVEACPASPHSDTNLKDKRLVDAFRSSLFVRIRESGMISLPHEGGCALAEHEGDVALLTVDKERSQFVDGFDEL